MTDLDRLVKSIRHSAYVWAAKKAKAEEPKTHDNRKRVDKCLNCPYCECIDCYNNPDAVAEEVCALTELGMSVSEICTALGISRRNVFRLKKRRRKMYEQHNTTKHVKEQFDSDNTVAAAIVR